MGPVTPDLLLACPVVRCKLSGCRQFDKQAELDGAPLRYALGRGFCASVGGFVAWKVGPQSGSPRIPGYPSPKLAIYLKEIQPLVFCLQCSMPPHNSSIFRCAREHCALFLIQLWPCALPCRSDTFALKKFYVLMVSLLTFSVKIIFAHNSLGASTLHLLMPFITGGCSNCYNVVQLQQCLYCK